MNNILVEKTYNVEVPITASSTQQQIFFPIIQVLDTKLTIGIDTYTPATILKTPSNAALANLPLLQVSYLTLVVGDVNQIWNIPMMDLVTLQDWGVAGSPAKVYATEFLNLKVIWAKSYVFIADTTKIAATAQSFMFNIKYADNA